MCIRDRCKTAPLAVTTGIGLEQHDHEGRVLTLEYLSLIHISTTAPLVASGANSTMIRLLLISTRLTPQMAASPQRDIMMVSAIPTVTSSSCSTSRCV